MDALSFSLGIAFVAVVAIAAVAVYAFVKVNKLDTNLKNLHHVLDQNVDHIYRSLTTETSTIHSRIDEAQKQTGDMVQGIYSQMDSRFDKLENKLSTGSKQILKG